MMMRLVAVMITGIVAGCALATSPAPVVDGDAGASDPWARIAQPAPPPVAHAQVSPLPVNVPITARPGQLVVKSGDTLFAIARRHGASLRALIDANGLDPPYGVRPGQVLLLPTAKLHRVGRGETLIGISRSYGVAASELVRLNQIKQPYHLLVGQALQLPGGNRTMANSNAAPPGMLDYAEDSTAPPAPAIVLKKQPIKPASMPPRAGKNFAWPTRGKILTGYGPRANGLHNDGINIAAKANAPVAAAENGVVSYAGNELEGYGNLLLIRHAGGWITAYAHNSKLLVRRGERIRRGQTIALAGRTGGLARDQLHFEIRNGAKPVNPMQLLVGG